jgi:hypothetical protein
MSKRSYKYGVGDHVRISKAKHQFRKVYLPNWIEEIFTIASRSNSAGPELVYRLSDLNDEEIEGVFYEKELQRVALPTDFRVECVLHKKKRGKKTTYLVKSLGWGDEFNSWVNEEDLHHVEADIT